MKEKGACLDCGAEIDQRALRCKRCAGYLRGRHRTYEQLRWEDFKYRASKNRYSAACYIDGEQKTVWRHRWHWEMNNGKVPPGYHVHHKNEDPSDDRLENLELKKLQEHLSDHHKREKSALWRGGRKEVASCKACGKEFTRWKSSRQKFCSMACDQKIRTMSATLILTCVNCGKEFERLKCKSNRPGKKQPFCSPECYLEHRWGTPRERTRQCAFCGSTFELERSRTKNSRSGKCYCSRECYQKDRFSTTLPSKMTTPSLQPAS